MATALGSVATAERPHRERMARQRQRQGAVGWPRPTTARRATRSTARPCVRARRRRRCISRRSRATKSCSRIGPAGTGKTYLAVAAAVPRCARRRSIASSWCVRRSRRARAWASCPATCRRRSIRTCVPCTTRSPTSCRTTRCAASSRRGVIEIAPLAFMRGRTLHNAFVILDEAQNTTVRADEDVPDAPGLELARGDHRRRHADRPARRRRRSGLVRIQSHPGHVPGHQVRLLPSRGRGAPPAWCSDIIHAFDSTTRAGRDASTTASGLSSIPQASHARSRDRGAMPPGDAAADRDESAHRKPVAGLTRSAPGHPMTAPRFRAACPGAAGPRAHRCAGATYARAARMVACCSPSPRCCRTGRARCDRLRYREGDIARERVVAPYDFRVEKDDATLRREQEEPALAGAARVRGRPRASYRRARALRRRSRSGRSRVVARSAPRRAGAGASSCALLGVPLERRAAEALAAAGPRAPRARPSWAAWLARDPTRPGVVAEKRGAHPRLSQHHAARGRHSRRRAPATLPSTAARRSACIDAHARTTRSPAIRAA